MINLQIHSLELEFVVENIHSFSLFAWPAGSSSKAVITCHGRNARLELNNVSSVTMNDLEFVRCFENHVISVGRFQVENSGFFGNVHDHVLVNGIILTEHRG